MSKIEDDREAFRVLKGIASKLKGFDVETFRDDFDMIANLPGLEYESLETRIKGMAARGDLSYYNALLANIKKIVESTLTTNSQKQEFKNLTVNDTKWFNKSKPITLRQLVNFYLSITSERRLANGQAKALKIIANEDEKTRASKAIQKSVNNALQRSQAKKQAENEAKRQAEAAAAEAEAKRQAEAEAKRLAEAKAIANEEELNKSIWVNAPTRAKTYKSPYKNRKDLLEKLKQNQINFIPSSNNPPLPSKSGKSVHFNGGKSRRTRRKSKSKRNTRSNK